MESLSLQDAQWPNNFTGAIGFCLILSPFSCSLVMSFASSATEISVGGKWAILLKVIYFTQRRKHNMATLSDVEIQYETITM